MKLTIRQAVLADVDTVHQMHVDWEVEEITGGRSADSVDRIAGMLGPYFLVAEIDGQIAGFVSTSLRVSEDTGFFPDGQEFVNVDDLYVRPQHRSGGIGARLVQEIVRIASCDGIDRFALSSNTKDFERVVKFYRSCGFQTWNATMFRQTTPQ